MIGEQYVNGRLSTATVEDFPGRRSTGVCFGAQRLYPPSHFGFCTRCSSQGNKSLALPPELRTSFAHQDATVELPNGPRCGFFFQIGVELDVSRFARWANLLVIRQQVSLESNS